MKQYLITLDTGTTNTRAVLWRKPQDMIRVSRSETGVRDTAAEGHNGKLKRAVRDCILELLATEQITVNDIAAVYASGMITSEMGLKEVPHLTAPAGKSDFARGVVSAVIPDICALPIHFIPGMKNNCRHLSIDTMDEMDIMRGEETEAIAMLEYLPSGKEYLLILPGSHSKFITVDTSGRMTGCLTSMTGEILSGLTHHSILTDAVDGKFVGEYHQELVLAGYRSAERVSFARTAFLTRIFGRFIAAEANDCANYLLGAVLQGDVEAVRSSQALSLDGTQRIAVAAGKEPLRTALADVFTESGLFQKTESYPAGNPDTLAGAGACLIAQARHDW